MLQPFTSLCINHTPNDACALCNNHIITSFEHLSCMPNLTPIFACLKKHLFANVCLKNAPTYYRVHNHAFTWLPVCPIMHLLVYMCPTMHLVSLVSNHAPTCICVQTCTYVPLCPIMHVPTCLYVSKQWKHSPTVTVSNLSPI